MNGAIARNVNFETLYGGQFALLSQLIGPRLPKIFLFCLTTELDIQHPSYPISICRAKCR